MKRTVFDSLVDGLYASALDPADWPEMAQMFARAFETEGCAIWRFDRREGVAEILGMTRDFDATAIGDYEDYCHWKDSVGIGMADSGAGQITLGAETFVEFANSRRHGCGWMVGAVRAEEPQVKGAIGIHGPQAARPFDANRKRQLAMLLPHLARAMRLGRRLQRLTQDRRIVTDALEKLSVGVMAVDARTNVLFANAEAERLLRTVPGLTFRDGRLGAVDPAKEHELRRMIHSACEAAPGTPSAVGDVLTLSRPPLRPLSLLACPSRPDMPTRGSSFPAALLIFGDPDASPSTSTRGLMELYGVTPAEARLMAALAEGESLEDYAERRKISINTARTQSKQIFAKTGVGRQADLIREVLSNPALRGPRRT